MLLSASPSITRSRSARPHSPDRESQSFAGAGGTGIAGQAARSRSVHAKFDEARRRDTNDVLDPGVAELELSHLQRQFRLMEGDRRAYSDESRIVIARQRATLETLRRDHQHLLVEARLLRARSGDAASGAGGAEARRMEELREAEARPHTSIPNNTNMATSLPAPSPKQILSLESRLDQALQKYNTSLLRLRHLRDTVSALRFERGMFDRVAGRVEREVMGCKRRMAEVVEESGVAYEARDDSQSKLAALKEKSDKEHQAYLSEIKELDRILEQDRKLKEFMAAKTGEARSARTARSHAASTRSAVAARRKLRGAESGTSPQGQPGMSGESAAGLKSASPVSSLLVDSASAALASSPDSPSRAAAMSRTWGANTAVMAPSALLSYYQDVWKEVGEVVGMVVEGVPTTAQVERVVKRVAGLEGENFSLFNFVTEINNEVEVANEEIATLQAKIAELRKEGDADEKETMGRVKKLETALSTLTMRRANHETELAQFHLDLSSLREHAALALAKLAELGPILSVFGLGGAAVGAGPLGAGPGSGTTTQQGGRDRTHREKHKEIKSVLSHKPRKEVGVLEVPELPEVTGEIGTGGGALNSRADGDKATERGHQDTSGSRPGTAPSSEESGRRTPASRPGSAGAKPRVKSARKALRFSVDVVDPVAPSVHGSREYLSSHSSQNLVTQEQTSSLAALTRTDSELASLLSQVPDVPAIAPALLVLPRPHDTPTKPQDPAGFTSHALAYLEKRTTDLLLLNFLVASLTRKPAAENVAAVDGVVAGGAPADRMLGVGPAPPVGGLVVEVPQTDERDSDGDGEGERPLTREELKAKSAREIAKREQEKREQTAESLPRKVQHTLSSATSRKTVRKKK
ncbi:hypothetical protein HDU93_003595 [Gonapodya sp. JEL0774]|nr:hypothetical protein HDU93_003595 [Gonapodya sp. JEL0774]